MPPGGTTELPPAPPRQPRPRLSAGQVNKIAWSKAVVDYLRHDPGRYQWVPVREVLESFNLTSEQLREIARDNPRLEIRSQPQGPLGEQIRALRSEKSAKW